MERGILSAPMRSQGDTAVRASPSITVRFRFFARYAELLGLETTSIHLTAPATVAPTRSMISVASGPGSSLSGGCFTWRSWLCVNYFNVNNS